MLQETLESLRQQGTELLICLNNNAKAQQERLAAGGTAGHLLSPHQLESWLMTGGAALPKEIAFSGSLSEFVSLFPKHNAEESKRKVNAFLAGVVAEYTNDTWDFYTCNVVVMGCCMGEYLSIVNRKELPR